MQGITEFEDSQEGRRKFRSLQRAAVRNLRKINKDNELGITLSEAYLVQEIISHSNFYQPWTWVQTGTQQEWADSWGLSVNSLKKWLKHLKEIGVLLCATAEVDRGMRGKKFREYEYPCWMVNPVIIELVADEYSHEIWCSKTQAGGELDAFAAAFLAAFEGPEARTFWPTVKCTSDTYSSGWRRVPKMSDMSQTLGNTGDTAGTTCVLATPTIDIDTSSSEEIQKGSDRVRRRNRRRLKSRSKVDTHAKMVTMSDPPPIGADPDDAQPEPRPRQYTPTSQVAQHFKAEWERMLVRADHPTRAKLGATPWADGSKVAFMSWVRKTLLPDHDNDIGLCKAMITQYCEQPIATHAASQRAPWRKFAGQQTKMRQRAYKAGYRTEAEIEAQQQEAEREAALRYKFAHDEEQRKALEDRRKRTRRRLLTDEEKWNLDVQGAEEDLQ